MSLQRNSMLLITLCIHFFVVKGLFDPSNTEEKELSVPGSGDLIPQVTNAKTCALLNCTDENAFCLQTPHGTAKCACKQGYVGDGLNCTEVRTVWVHPHGITYLSSSNYPNPFPSNIDQYYRLRIYGDSRITCNMKIRVQLLAFNFPDYNGDFLAVYDGNSTSSPLKGIYHTFHQPPNIFHSTTNEMLIHFHSDEHLGGNFRLSFVRVQNLNFETWSLTKQLIGAFGIILVFFLILSCIKQYNQSGILSSLSRYTTSRSDTLRFQDRWEERSDDRSGSRNSLPPPYEVSQEYQSSSITSAYVPTVSAVCSADSPPSYKDFRKFSCPVPSWIYILLSSSIYHLAIISYNFFMHFFTYLPTFPFLCNSLLMH